MKKQTASLVHKWQPEQYDQKLGFVSEFGKGVIEWLNPQSGERVLDIGCGTGDLAHEITKYGALVTGMDLSEEMITVARSKYPNLTFRVGNAESFNTEDRFDAVFSNAALHWTKKAPQVIQRISRILVPEGRFVAEFGGKGNVETIINATTKILTEDFGIDAARRNPWYFPTIGEYAALLEAGGFRVIQAGHFDRPTLLSDGERGLFLWLDTFGSLYFAGLSGSDKSSAYRKIEASIKPTLFHDGAWYADYKRIRISAVVIGK